MSSEKDKRTSIPIIGFVIHRLKLLVKTLCFSKEGLEQILEKKKTKEKKEKEFNLNLLFRLGISKPLDIFGHIIQRYHLANNIGITLLLIYGYYFIKIDFSLHYFPIRCLLLVICLTPFPLIIAFVAILRSFEEKYDILGDGNYLLDSNDLVELAKCLAWSDVDPEVEGADWIRHLLEQLWGNVNRFLIRFVNTYFPNNSLEPIIGPINQLANFEIKKIYLGKRVPRITGIHVLKRGVRREDLIVDCEITFDSDLEFEISGKYLIDFGIKWFYFKAKTRILLTPLLRELPIVGNVQISFLERPRIDWEFTGLLRALNIYLLKSLVQCIVSYFFEKPHFFNINLAKLQQKKETKLREPIGLLRIEVMSAKYVHRKDGPKGVGCNSPCAKHSDPYCKVEVEEQIQLTHIIQNDSHPEWNKEFCFLVHNSILNSIMISVFDEDMIEDELIGKFSVPIKDFVDYRELNGREIVVPLTKTGQRLESIGKGMPRISFRVSWFRLTTSIKPSDINLRQSRSQLPVAALSILVDSCTGLDTCTEQVRSPEMRPLVKISVGNQVRLTTCKRRTGCPVWEESFHFILYNPILETIRFEVIDMYWVEEKQLLPFIPVSVSTFGAIAETVGLSDKGTVLGTYEIQTIDVLNAHKMKIEDSYRLNGFVEKGHIRLLAAVRITEFESEPFVSENVRQPLIELSQLMKAVNQRIGKESVLQNEVKVTKDVPKVNEKTKS